MKPRPAVSKAVSKRKFSFIADVKIEDLKQIKLKKKTESKVNWAVTAYNEWRDERMRTFKYDPSIYWADLRSLETLEKCNFERAMCAFVPEVTKVRGEGPYPGSTLYQMVLAIQKYLNVHRLTWQLLDDREFPDLKIVLDNVMKERAALNVGMTTRQASVITYQMENHLWETGVLGEHSPDKLRNTVLFLIGINVYLRAIDEHYSLRRDMPSQRSQISFEYNDSGVQCLVYREDFVTKTHDGGINDHRQDRKVVWVYPSENAGRCPVRLTQKYLSLCPTYIKKPNFYLQSRVKFLPNVWYAGQVVGENSIAKVVQELMKEAKIEGFFTNHSLRRSGSTRLFRAGIDRKLVKEATGHRSDAIDKYQITSDEQREAMSRVISGPIVKSHTISKTRVMTEPVENEVKTEDVTSKPCRVKSCTCGENVTNVCEILEKIVTASKQKGKTVIKLEIEISNE